MTTNPLIEAVPRPVTAGTEMAALRRFYRDMRWTGAIAESGMGPGTPAMTATGAGTHELIQDGRWIVGSYRQDQFLADGTYVLRWELLWVTGWDPALGEYRAVMADNYGHTGVMRGRIDGNVLTYETIGDAPVRLRLTWDLTRPPALVWRNEMSAGGAPWFLVEEYDCVPV